MNVMKIIREIDELDVGKSRTSKTTNADAQFSNGRCFNISSALIRLIFVLLMGLLLLLLIFNCNISTRYCNKFHGDSPTMTIKNKNEQPLSPLSHASSNEGHRYGCHGNHSQRRPMEINNKINIDRWKTVDDSGNVSRVISNNTHRRAPSTKATDTAAVNRPKRSIIFNGAGVVKFVFGVSYPIQLVDKTRSLSYFYNFQIQYPPPPQPLYWWSLYNTSTFAARHYKSRRPSRDMSRSRIYAAIEGFFESFGLPSSSSSCLLRAICEVTQCPFHAATDSIFHAIFNAIFIPTLPNVASKYWQAREAGRRQANCSDIYGTCPLQSNWLENISHYL